MRHFHSTDADRTESPPPAPARLLPRYIPRQRPPVGQRSERAVVSVFEGQGVSRDDWCIDRGLLCILATVQASGLKNWNELARMKLQPSVRAAIRRSEATTAPNTLAQTARMV